MRYLQIKSGNKLHLIYESDDHISNPICGIKADNYRMTINVPLGYSCQNCQKVYRANKGNKERSRFLKSLQEAI